MVLKIMLLPWMNLKLVTKKILDVLFRIKKSPHLRAFLWIKILTGKKVMSEALTPHSITPRSILEYWYSDRIKSQWFNSTKELDQEIKTNYEGIWKDALKGKLSSWKESAEGCLALAIILDQFPLNMFRGEVKSFSTEAMAVKIARLAIKNNFDKAIDKDKLAFLYMPLMHSENIEDQNLSVKLFEQAG